MYQKSRVQSSPDLIFIKIGLCSFLDLITANIRPLVFDPYELPQRSGSFILSEQPVRRLVVLYQLLLVPIKVGKPHAWASQQLQVPRQPINKRWGNRCRIDWGKEEPSHRGFWETSVHLELTNEAAYKSFSFPHSGETDSPVRSWELDTKQERRTRPRRMGHATNKTTSSRKRPYLHHR